MAGAGAAALFAQGCATSSARSTSAPAEQGSAAEANGLAAARARTIEEIYLLTGELHAVRSLELVTPRSSSWEVQVKWLGEDGAELHAGDRAIEFDNSQTLQTIEEKKLALIQSEIQLESKAASLEADREDRRFALSRAGIAAERARATAAIPEDLLDRRTWQQNQAALATAEAALEKARLDASAFEVSSKADLEVLRIARDKASRDIESARTSLEALALRAPRDGIFVIGDYWREDRKFQVGDTTWPGQTVASIPDLTEMEVIGSLPEVDDGRIAAGMPARCILDTYPEHLFEGRVEEVASVGEEGGPRSRGGFRVRVGLKKSDPALMRPGMSVRVEIVQRGWERALTIPREAVRREGRRSWVVKPGRSEPIDVTLAACTPTDCIVETGLSEGDRVELR